MDPEKSKFKDDCIIKKDSVDIQEDIWDDEEDSNKITQQKNKHEEIKMELREG